MPTIVRPATVADAPDVADIYVSSWNAGFAGIVPARVLTPDEVDRWARELGAAPPARWWVAERDERTAGFIGIRPADLPDEGAGEIDTIAVAPVQWRGGVGRELMRVGVAGMRAAGHDEAILWTWRDYERGRAFYEATGWHRDGGERRDGQHVRYRRRL